MNALQSMMKATARVRRDGTEAEIPAEQVVVGDAVLISAGDEVPADGRIVTSSELQIDESALTGESVPAAGERRNAPVTSASPVPDRIEHGVMPAGHRSGAARADDRHRAPARHPAVGPIARASSRRRREEADAASRGGRNTLRPRIVAVAIALSSAVMFALGITAGTFDLDDVVRHGGGARDRGDPAGPPMVVQVVLAAGQRRARQGEGDRQGPAVGRDARVHLGDQLRQDRDADDERDAVGRGGRPDRPLRDHGHRLQPGRKDQPSGRRVPHHRPRDPAVLVASDTKLVDGTVVGDPTEGALLVLARQGGRIRRATREQRLHPIASLPSRAHGGSSGDGSTRPRMLGPRGRALLSRERVRP